MSKNLTALSDRMGFVCLAASMAMLAGGCGVAERGSDVAGTVPAKTFMVAGYNVENLFDQVDDTRNESYGDYRIKPNAAGQSSNWAEKVQFEGRSTTFTEVKAAGVARVLAAIQPGGPEIVGLTEIESRGALDAVMKAAKSLGYKNSVFVSDVNSQMPDAVGAAVISKFPIRSKSLVDVRVDGDSSGEGLRPILKVTLETTGAPLTVYVNHWKSQGGPESLRIKSAEALVADIEMERRRDANFDYVALGDFNSRHNENELMTPENNDTNGRTGMNDVLGAGGDFAALSGAKQVRYNLAFDLPKTARRTEFSGKYGWADFDHLIIGNSAVDGRGVNIVPKSFVIANETTPGLGFLFNGNGETQRWRFAREGRKFTRHAIGGYSDHVPVFARFTATR